MKHQKGMVKNMNISVIIPFHEGIPYLTDCLDSLKEQPYRDMEVLLVRDHAAEPIDDLLAGYQKELTIKVYTTGEKTGVAAARNLGLEHAKGTYIYFLDSDDYLYEDVLEKLAVLAEEKNLDIAYGKKVGTWFKRELFIHTFVPSYMENNEDGDMSMPEEGAAEGNDSTQQASDEQTEETPNDEEKEEFSNSDQEGEQIEEGLTEEELLEKQEVEKLFKTDFEERLAWLEEQYEKQLQQENQKGSFAAESNGMVSNEIPLELVRLRKASHMIARKRSAAESYLLTSKKETKNVSVLNILFRRELLEKFKIRFDEKFLLYADLTFVVQALYYGKRFDRDLKAFYVKRKHNDPIHQPSISQIKMPTRFEEHLEAYEEATGLVPMDSTLRKILDRKMIYYFTGDFARRMKRSKDDSYRTERFQAMRELVNKMNPDVLKAQKGYKKKFLHHVRNGNVKGAVATVKRRLAWKKFKSITSNRKNFAKFLYIHVFLKMKVKENVVLFESFFGKNYSDSPKYIYEYLAKNYGKNYKLVWVIDKEGTKIPYKHKEIKRYGILYSYYMARASYFVLNTRQPSWYIKRKKTTFLETWHGTPLKKLVFDQEEVTAASPLYKEQFYRQDKKWDYLIAANQFSSETFRRCFMYPNKMLEYGYPRNDIMHAENREEIAENLRRKLGIPEGKKTILYAPTWRDDEFYGSGQYKFTLKLDLPKMKAALGKEYVILLRTHYYIADSIDVTGVEDFAMNFSKYDDISELYLISDICITDYSSVFFDYANLRRPMLFFTYDLDKYRDVLRGFYIDMFTEVPGPLLFTTEEVIQAIQNIEAIKKKYEKRYDEFYERFCSWEDGHASENCVKEVFGLE